VPALDFADGVCEIASELSTAEPGDSVCELPHCRKNSRICSKLRWRSHARSGH
jgi:hypothetical protein